VFDLGGEIMNNENWWDVSKLGKVLKLSNFGEILPLIGLF
jgi:hypothetical protein